MKAHLLALAVGLCAACSASRAGSTQPLAPAEAFAQIRIGFERIAAAEDAPAARAAWEHAHDAFARGLEEPVRAACGDRAATELEYGFARLAATLPHHTRETMAPFDARRERIVALSRALEQSLGCL